MSASHSICRIKNQPHTTAATVSLSISCVHSSHEMYHIPLMGHHIPLMGHKKESRNRKSSLKITRFGCITQALSPNRTIGVKSIASLGHWVTHTQTGAAYLFCSARSHAAVRNASCLTACRRTARLFRMRSVVVGAQSTTYMTHSPRSSTRQPPHSRHHCRHTEAGTTHLTALCCVNAPTKPIYGYAKACAH